MPDALDWGQWNRTLLHRQHLLNRVDEDAIEVLDRCVGIQSQDPRAAFAFLASRLAGFEATELDDLLVDREVVRMTLLRGTIFLIDAEDARWIRPLAQPVLDLEIERTFRPRLVAADPAAIIDRTRELLDGTELSGAALGRALAQSFPDEAPSTLTAVARCGLPLVQVPPRGRWRGSGAPTYRLFDDWAGPGEPAVTGEDAVRDLIRLYLRGHGPASVQGITTWSGLPGLAPVLSAMEAEWELVELVGPDGTALYDLDGLDIIDGDTPAPVRLLAPYDHVVTSSADRRRVTDDEHFRATTTPNGRSPGFVFIDGRLAGKWSTAADDDGEIAVTAELFVDPTAAQRTQLDAEIARLEDFHRTGRT